MGQRLIVEKSPGVADLVGALLRCHARGGAAGALGCGTALRGVVGVLGHGWSVVSVQWGVSDEGSVVRWYAMDRSLGYVSSWP